MFLYANYPNIIFHSSLKMQDPGNHMLGEEPEEETDEVSNAEIRHKITSAKPKN